MKRDAASSTISIGYTDDVTYETSTKELSVPSYIQQYHIVQHDTATLTTEEKYKLEEELFYKSYDPAVGFNTAIVLAGLLTTILMYVFYRTKIRKPLIRFVKRKFKEWTKGYKTKYPPEEAEPMNDVEVPICDDTFTECKKSQGCESLKDSSVAYSVGKEKKPLTENLQCQFSIDEFTNLPKLTITDEDNQALPIVFMDMDANTADWVHKQHQFLNPGGLIVKVKSDNICPPNNEFSPSRTNGPVARQTRCTNPHCRLNVKDQVFCAAHSQNALNLCKSIPMFDSHGLTMSSLQNEKKEHGKKRPRRKRHQKVRRFSSVASEHTSQYLKQMPNHNPPLSSKMASVESEPLSSVSGSYKSPLVKQSSIPLHITPIIKIQNVDKSQRNIHDLHKKDSRESLSSSSSEDQSFYNMNADKWHSRKHYPPPSRSMTEDTPPSSRAFHRCGHAPKLPQTYKQLSLEDACQLGLLVPASKLSQSSLSCQNMSHSEETRL